MARKEDYSPLLQGNKKAKVIINLCQLHLMLVQKIF